MITILVSYYDIPEKSFSEMLKKIRQSNENEQAMRMIKQVIDSRAEIREKVKKVKRS